MLHSMLSVAQIQEMWNWVYTALGLLASLAVILAFLTPDLGRHMVMKLKREPSYTWEDVPKRISRARTRVWVLQTWLPSLRRERQWWLEALGKQSLEFRVLLLDQKLVP